MTPIPTTGELEELSSIEEPTVIEALTTNINKPVVLMDPCIAINDVQNLPNDEIHDTSASKDVNYTVTNPKFEFEDSTNSETSDRLTEGVIDSSNKSINKAIKEGEVKDFQETSNIDQLNLKASEKSYKTDNIKYVNSEQPGSSTPIMERRTPLKSLLKKPSVDRDLGPDSSDSSEEGGGGQNSPKKVHFSEVDQIKLMSQDSLSSMAASVECSGCCGADIVPVQLCKTIMTSTPAPSVAKLVDL